MKAFRAIKKILVVTLLTGVVLIAGIILALFIFQDRIKTQVIREINKQLNTHVDVVDFNVSILERFPALTLGLKNVEVEDSWKTPGRPLLIAESVHLSLDPLKFIRGEVEIIQLYLDRGSIDIQISPSGQNNFQIFKKREAGSGNNTIVDLNMVYLTDVGALYSDHRRDQIFSFSMPAMESSIKIRSDTYVIRMLGDIQWEFIQIGSDRFLENRQVKLNSGFEYVVSEDRFDLNTMQLFLAGSEFAVDGQVEKGKADLVIKGTDSSIGTLLSLLPNRVREELTNFRSQGEVYFDMTLKGGDNGETAVEIDFGMIKASLSHPRLVSDLSEVTLTGHYRNATLVQFDQGYLSLEEVSGLLEGHPFNAQANFRNLESPVADIEFAGSLPLTSVFSMVPKSRLETANGLISGEISLSGRMKDLQSIRTASNVTTSGHLALQDARFVFESGYPPPTRIDGSFAFTKNDLAIDNATFQIGNSAFIAEGAFSNILGFLFFEDQPLGVHGRIKATNLDMDELLQSDTQPMDGDVLEIAVYPKLRMEVDYDVDRLSYKRFVGKRIKGEVQVRNQVVRFKKVAFESAGGKMQFSGMIDASGKNLLVSSNSTLEGIYIDSVFHVFDNFKQNWLVSQNLRGQAYANVVTEMGFTRTLDFLHPSLIADIDISIRNGQLNNFEPLMALETYIDDENLAQLRFSDIGNSIHIEDQVIYLPEMEVRSNVSNIRISGRHTFNQQIDYRVVVPMRSLQKKRNESLFGAVEEDVTGSKLHLKIVGTTDDYEIGYDYDGVKKKIVSDLIKEVHELKNAFRKKDSTRTEEIQLNTEEYFEWEEDTIRDLEKRPRRPDNF